ncbi:glutaminyl-peptide cyclotransferase [Pseudonocardia sp. TRM90224]|uniref:glutaminyl-peptide cyclotransferase n=1 Tax=Pseudonocardia sp. TRM90224 TaxID=2812678 RepID=UPI001E3789B7|nr:glutaminyl-peptide cyclotransferase [Pseudonocardia sp. TRM90224]
MADLCPPAVRALAAALVLVIAGCGAGSVRFEELRPEVLEQVPHDATAFTQGLELRDGGLYETTGVYGSSQLRELDPATGGVRRAVPLPPTAFGEGMTVVDSRIWQVTWKEGVAYEWDRATFGLLREVPITGEGWGLCYDGGRLVRSDGTNRLRFHDPTTFDEQGSVEVTLRGEAVPGLNELECVDGAVWANVWPTERIVRIDPGSGEVTGLVQAASLVPPGPLTPGALLNGIAAAGDGEFWITGKYWPTMYRVRFEPAA